MKLNIIIISVCYRVKSQNSIIFRRWANKVLKNYLLKGYAVNEKRLAYLEKTVMLIDIASRTTDELTNDEAIDIIKNLSNYSSALNLLDDYDYDYNKIKKPKGIKDKSFITYGDCIIIIIIIKKLKFNNKSSLFALGLKRIIDSIYQSFNSNDLYPSVEEKAANFLYMIVKDHVFIDGNKVIDNNALVAVTLLIAQSNPNEKEVLIDLTMNFLNN